MSRAAAAAAAWWVGDAAKVEQAAAAGRLLGGDYLAAVTAEALKTAECNACMKRIVAAPTAGSCGVLPAVLLPLAQAGEASDEAICGRYVARFREVIPPGHPRRRRGRLPGRGGRLLTTKLFCGHCGALMFGESGTQRL